MMSEAATQTVTLPQPNKPWTDPDCKLVSHLHEINRAFMGMFGHPLRAVTIGSGVYASVLGNQQVLTHTPDSDPRMFPQLGAGAPAKSGDRMFTAKLLSIPWIEFTIDDRIGRDPYWAQFENDHVSCGMRVTE